MHRGRGQPWRGRGGFGPAGWRPAIEQGAAAGGQADDSAEGGVPVQQGPNPVRHAHVASVGTVGSWEGDHEYLPRPAARRGGARQETTLPVAPAQALLQQGTFTTEQVEEMCVRYAANETATLQQRLNQTGQLLADSQRRVHELEEMLQTSIDKLEAREHEITAMSKQLALLHLRVPTGGQQAPQQHPRAPTQNFAGLPPRAATATAAPPAAAPRPQEMQQQRRPVLNLGAQPFRPARPALPAPSPLEQQQQQQALVLAPRNFPPPAAVAGPSRLQIPTPQRLLPGSPQHEGDVFDPSVPDRMPWRPAQFEKKPTRELLVSAFDKVKSLVHTQPYNHIPQTKQPGEHDFIGLGIKHLQRAKMVYEMLTDIPRYRLLVSGIIISLLVDAIFTKAAILDFPQDQDGHMAAFTTRYQAEKEITPSDPVYSDFSRRMTIAENRAEAARNIQRLPRFWKWFGEKAQVIAEDICTQVNIVIMRDHRYFKDTVAQAANELLRIHVRILQEPALYKFEWLGTGFAWVGDKMIARDPKPERQAELAGRNCPWVTQCMMTPLVTVEKFERTAGSERVFSEKETLMKAEVTLCARKGNLRQ